MNELPPSEILSRRNERCAEKSGFLFSHACGQFADHSCFQCKKPICSDHASAVNADIYCVTCAGQVGGDQHASQRKPWSPDRDAHDTSPYWYAQTYYGPGYSWTPTGPSGQSGRGNPPGDSLEFNDADESVLMDPDNDVEWEQDMGAS